jgi:hypothetical protein
MDSRRRRPHPVSLPQGVHTVGACMAAVLHRIAGRQPATVGYALARLRRAYRLTPEKQAAALGLTPLDLARLATLPRPRPDRREEDMAALSAAVGVDAGVLAELLRQAEALGPSLDAPPTIT